MPSTMNAPQDPLQAPQVIHLADEVWTLEEAAAFCRLSPDTLRRSDCPRARVNTRVVYLKSQCLLWIQLRLSHRIEGAA